MAINLTQEFTFETDSLDSFATVLAAVVPILFWADGEQFCVERASFLPGAQEHPSDAAAFFLRRRYGGVDAWRESPEAQEPLYWPVCRLRPPQSYDPWRETAPRFPSAQQAVEEALRQVAAADPAEFWARSSRWRAVLTAGDGAVRPGYRAHKSTRVGEVLTVSLCYIYYAK
jgi:hypothetical protein